MKVLIVLCVLAPACGLKRAPETSLFEGFDLFDPTNGFRILSKIMSDQLKLIPEEVDERQMSIWLQLDHADVQLRSEQSQDQREKAAEERDMAMHSKALARREAQHLGVARHAIESGNGFYVERTGLESEDGSWGYSRSFSKSFPCETETNLTGSNGCWFPEAASGKIRMTVFTARQVEEGGTVQFRINGKFSPFNMIDVPLPEIAIDCNACGDFCYYKPPKMFPMLGDPPTLQLPLAPCPLKAGYARFYKNVTVPKNVDMQWRGLRLPPFQVGFHFMQKHKNGTLNIESDEVVRHH